MWSFGRSVGEELSRMSEQELCTFEVEGAVAVRTCGVRKER